MKRTSSYFITVLINLCLAASTAYAQEKWEEGGEIESVEIEIVKERQITLPRADRNFDKIPPRPAEPITPAISYDFKSFRFTTPDFQPVLRPLRLKQEELQKINGGYLSAGLGNFGSAFLGAAITSKRNANRYTGADLLHRSFATGPVRGRNSGSGNTQMNFFTGGFNNHLAGALQVGYENIATLFYGFQPPTREVKRDTLRQMFHIVSFGAKVENVKPSDFNYKLSGSFSYLDDRFQAAESIAGLQFNSNYALKNASKILVASSYRLLARKDSLVEAKPRSLFRITPSYQFTPIEKLTVTAGFSFVYENDTIGSKDVHLYPSAHAAYQLSKGVEAFASLTGDMEEVSLHGIARENAWVNANVDIFHANNQLDFRAGLRGKAGAKGSFLLGAAVSSYRHLYLYVNAMPSPERFDLVYDQVTRTNLFGEWGLVNANRFSLRLRGDYFGYSVDREREAWHRPAYRVAVHTDHNFFEKVSLQVNFSGLGGMKAWDQRNSKVVELDAALDLNVKARYFVSKPFSVFLEGSNLLNSDYPIYLYYPVRGLQVTGGLSWSF